MEAVRMLLTGQGLFVSVLRKALVQGGIQIVGETTSGEEAIVLVDERVLDVVLMELSLPGIGSVEAVRRISVHAPLLPVLMLSTDGDEPRVVDALVAGASGALPKEAPVEQLLAGIRAATAGESPISPPVAQHLLLRIRAASSRKTKFEGDPSARELQVLRLRAAGKNHHEIVRELSLETNAVGKHILSLLRKLQINSRIEAAVEARLEASRH